jgi:rod shape determining protein RodA
MLSKPLIAINTILIFISKKSMIVYLTITIFLFGLFQLFGNSPAYATKQIQYGIIGFIIFLIVRTRVVRVLLPSLVIPFYLLTIALLILVLFQEPINGASRWFDMGFISIQPSEFAKISVILCAAYLFTFVESRTSNAMLTFLLTIILSGLPAFLVFLQPDFGSSILIFIVPTICTLLVGKLGVRHIAYITVLFVIFFVLTFFFMKDFQKQRILSFIAKFSNAQTLPTDFNSLQAQIAVGSGGIFGKGLASGTQSKLAFLPEDHTDFAFSSFIEQFGIFGALLLMMLFVLIFRVAIIGYYNSRNLFLRHLSLSIGLLFLIQTTINAFMNLGLLPIVGIPFPFLSYGGSSLMIWFFLFGLL